MEIEDNNLPQESQSTFKRNIKFLCWGLGIALVIALTFALLYPDHFSRMAINATIYSATAFTGFWVSPSTFTSCFKLLATFFALFA